MSAACHGATAACNAPARHLGWSDCQRRSALAQDSAVGRAVPKAALRLHCRRTAQVGGLPRHLKVGLIACLVVILTNGTCWSSPA